MKNVLIALLFIPCFSFAQIGVAEKETIIGKIAPMNTLIAELRFRSDSIYTFRFLDMKAQDNSIKSVEFSGNSNTLDQLYILLKSVFTDENKNNKDYLITVPLGKKQVTISHTKGMGVTACMFSLDDSYVILSDKQIDKLFSK